MADNRTAAQRSYNMSRIRSTNTKPELQVRRFLFSNGIRYRLHSKKLPGKPDIVINKLRTVVFVHGCFWHGHKNCKFTKIPKTNTKFWSNKIHANSERDIRNERALKKLGWRVFIIWECELLQKKVEKTLERLLNNLSSKN